jgi:hypothetical protein
LGRGPAANAEAAALIGEMGNSKRKSAGEFSPPSKVLTAEFQGLTPWACLISGAPSFRRFFATACGYET